MNNIVILSLFSLIFACSSHKSEFAIQKQGSFAVGGTVVTVPGTFDPIKQGVWSPKGPDTTGQTLHGDHAYVSYQIPVNARKLPLVFWHGFGQSAKTWETTPDGRDGFNTIFLKRNYPVYLFEQPGRGRAGKSTADTTVPASASEQLWFGIFRLGQWPDFYDNVSFSRDPEALNQFFRQAVPDTGPSFQNELYISAMSALFNKIGNGILVTHSASGSLGWKTFLRNEHIRAIVSYEPGGDFVFPEGEKVEATTLGIRVIQPATIPKAEFMKFTKIPIVIYYGDNIPDAPDVNPGKEQWRAFLSIARKWAKVVNAYGGDVQVVHLPSIGITGNTHFPFSDLNNLQVADELSKFLKAKKLD